MVSRAHLGGTLQARDWQLERLAMFKIVPTVAGLKLSPLLEFQPSDVARSQ